ncbi:amino acid-binding protein [Actinocatenispora rupis]|uniref:Amino acid-binding protein n=1 Tax=Actinocatenispora rupis TaxID=519421 RepID=A0A8J3N7N7_9ACTN|nr:amino acid-binding protein [Actinocatenispora rupis]GID09484.1 amino acid-binding protein [Actinocatenispora rupis]
MLVRARVALPDAPGSLGRLAWTLGVLGADILQVSVLETGSGRAVDELTLRLGSLTLDELRDRIQVIPGVRVLAVWRPRAVSRAADATVLGQLARHPDRGLSTLVDAAPDLFAAEWAVLLGGGGPEPTAVRASFRAPQALAVGALEPLRPRGYTLPDGTHAAMAPLAGGTVLLVARAAGPAFHRTEVDRLDQLVDAASGILGTDRTVAAAG